MLSRKKRKRKPSQRTFLEKTADDIFSLLIRERDRWQCFFRGKDDISCNGPMQNNHIVSRSYRAVRFACFNAVCGCSGHNLHYKYHQADLERLYEKWEPEKYALAMAGKHTSGKRSAWELEMIIRENLTRLKELQSEGIVLDGRTRQWISRPKHARFVKGIFE